MCLEGQAGVGAWFVNAEAPNVAQGTDSAQAAFPSADVRATLEQAVQVCHRASGIELKACAARLEDRFTDPERFLSNDSGTLEQEPRTSAIPGLLAKCDQTNLNGTLRSLTLTSMSEDAELWQPHFGHVLILVLDSLVQKEGARDVALLCLEAMLTNQRSCFADFAEVVACKLFETYRLCSQAERHVIAAIDRSLEKLVGSLEPPRALQLLVPVVSSEGLVSLLQTAMKLISAVLQRMTQTKALDHLGVALPGLVLALSNDNPQVRKASVFCLVDLYMVLGEEVLPQLVQVLTPYQMKLVTLYIGRQRERCGSSKLQC